MTEFVLGFMFNDDRTEVALIRKNRGPNDMAGYLNGIGGKIEASDQDGLETMTREFLEETGVRVDDYMWTHFLTKRIGEHYVRCYRCRMTKLCHQATTVTDEVVGIYRVDDVLNDPTLKCYPGVTELIKLAIAPPKPYIPPLILPVMAPIHIDVEEFLKMKDRAGS